MDAHDSFVGWAVMQGTGISSLERAAAAFSANSLQLLRSKSASHSDAADSTLPPHGYDCKSCFVQSFASGHRRKLMISMPNVLCVGGTIVLWRGF